MTYSAEPVGGDEIVLAEFGSLQLELVRLSQLTGNKKYENAGNSILEKISKVPSRFPGLYPMIWNLDPFIPENTYITISGGSDSYYEYLLKTHILMEGKEDLQLDMWKTAVGSMHRYLRSETHGGKVYLAEFEEHYKLLQSGELVCFMPGNLLLGARYLDNKKVEKFALELMNSCYDVWETPTGLAPETWSWIDKSQNISFFSEKMQLTMSEAGFLSQDTGYDLRPGNSNDIGFFLYDIICTKFIFFPRKKKKIETIESLFYFYRITGDKTYQVNYNTCKIYNTTDTNEICRKKLGKYFKRSKSIVKRVLVILVLLM